MRVWLFCVPLIFRLPRAVSSRTHFPRHPGSSTCSLCAPGRVSVNTSSAECDACPPGMQCLLGAALPTPPQRTDQSVLNPFTATGTQNQETVLGIGQLVLGACTPVVLLIIATGVAGEKSPRFRRFAAAHCAVFDCARLDVLFGDLHYRSHGHAMVFKKTAFGAAMSIAACVAFVGVGITLGVNSIMFPVYASSVSPQPPPWEPRGVYQLVVTVFGGGGMADQCSSGTLNGTDDSFRIHELNAADWSAAPTRVSNAYNPRDGSCTLTWRCDKRCMLRAVSSATLQLRSPPRSWASHVSFKVSTPLFASNSTPAPEFGSAPFQFERSFYAPPTDGQGANSFSALRGKVTINLALTPYIVNASSTETKAVAFEPSLLGISYGNVTTFETFNFSEPDSFTLDFVLSRNTLSLVFTASSSTVFTFFVLLSSVAGSVVSVFAVLVKQVESMLEIRDATASDLPQHALQVDVETGRSKAMPASIEMSNVLFAADSPSGTWQRQVETTRMLETKIHQLEQELKRSDQRHAAARREHADAYQHSAAAQDQCIQHLAATLAEVVELLPASDRSRQLRLHLGSARLSAPHVVAESRSLPSPQLVPVGAPGPIREPPASAIAGTRGDADGYGQMCDDE